MLIGPRLRKSRLLDVGDIWPVSLPKAMVAVRSRRNEPANGMWRGTMGRSKEGKDEIAVLIDQIEEHDDPRQSYALLKENMARYRARGVAIPEGLLRVQKALETDLITQSRGA